ncbi:hypothetical protein [Limibacterium fermenti]|jgi:hypothetical protein|uniref:hypothetical protein n=1 Tax=Limibacterium fermenti TaxID=3229863 RepID=UPI003A7A4BCF
MIYPKRHVSLHLFQYSAKLRGKIVVKARSKNAKYCQTTPRNAKTDKRVKILFLFAEKKKV